MADTDVQIWAGLGNPGAGYAQNRHNIGFMAVDRIALDHGFDRWREKSGAEISSGRIADVKIILVKPQQFMNKSGLPLAEITRFYKVKPDSVSVFHDELDIAAGKLRIKQAGGHGGHNGLRDIDRHLGINYWRLRLGIGRPARKEEVHKYVLQDFTKSEQADWLEPLLHALSDEAAILAKGDQMRYMSRIAFLAPAPTAPDTKEA